MCALSPAPDATWDQAFARMSGLKALDQPVHARILASIVPECCYAALHDGDTIAACGLGVLQDGWLGLYDIVVAPEHRRKGYGEQVVRDLLAWGKQVGAHSTYLQVMLNNPAGLSLYAKVGYRQAYTYWYRVKDLDP
jgi:ribosomal protein S18 acetylase RimI-like enzyme